MPDKKFYILLCPYQLCYLIFKISFNLNDIINFPVTENFDFLGFTLINGMTMTGKYRVVYRTSKKKLKAKKQAVKEWLWKNMHGKPSDIIEKLNRKLIGHYAYYGISGNWEGLLKFYRYILTAFYKALTRRSQRAYLTIKRYYSLLKKHPIALPKLYVNIWT